LKKSENSPRNVSKPTIFVEHPLNFDHFQLKLKTPTFRDMSEEAPFGFAK